MHNAYIGRIEAVMVSCPPLVAWDYNHTPMVGSSEEALMGILSLHLFAAFFQSCTYVIN
jgi:coproporphyrinogen III oxidase